MSKFDELLTRQNTESEAAAKRKKEIFDLEYAKKVEAAVQYAERMKTELLTALGTETIQALEEIGLEITVDGKPTGSSVNFTFQYSNTTYTLSYFSYQGQGSLTISSPYKNLSKGRRTIDRMDADPHARLTSNLTNWLLEAINKDRNYPANLK